MSSHPDYLREILTSSVYDVAVETPLERARQLSRRLHNTVLLKREDTQSVFSFKIRGAYNKMVRLDTEQAARGVICASAGNHAQGVALSAKRLGMHALIVMPVTTPHVKVDAVRALGAEVVLHGESYSDAEAHALERSRDGRVFIHPFDDPDVIAGQGTIGMEILRQQSGQLDAIFVPIGGGGLVAGIASYVKKIRPDVRIIGVQTTDSDAMARSVAAGRRVRLDHVGTFSDGTAVKMVGAETFRIARRLVDEFITVDVDAICAAIKDVFLDTRSIVEPAGAMAVAAVKQYTATTRAKGETLVALTCGANMNFDRLGFVAERAELGERREAIFAVTVPEERGSFKRFCAVIAPEGTARAVTAFSYRISDPAAAHVFVGLSITRRDEAARIQRSLESHGFPAIDLTDDELAKEHVRHMVGGHSRLATDERLFRFTFPERPGALMRFLELMQPTWNISLFNYRHQGGDSGRILVGIQVPPKDDRALQRFLSELNYPVVEETDNPVYRLFLQ